MHLHGDMNKQPACPHTLWSSVSGIQTQKKHQHIHHRRSCKSAAVAINAAAIATLLPPLSGSSVMPAPACCAYSNGVVMAEGQEDSGQAGHIPLDTATWLDDLLARVFAVLENLEAPETRSESMASSHSLFGGANGGHPPSASFILDKQSMFKCVGAPPAPAC